VAEPGVEELPGGARPAKADCRLDYGGQMILRRFCVTVMDNWTAMRRFFTLYGAQRWRAKVGMNAHLYEWTGVQWLERIQMTFGRS
jgi:hypothetical protein